MNRLTLRQQLYAACAGLALVPLLLGLALAEPPEADVIKNRLQQYEARFNQGNAEAVARLYSEDVVYYDPLGRVHEGRDAVQAYYQRSLAAGFSDMAINKIEIEVFGDMAYDIARYTISDPKGRRLTGYHLAILAKEDGEWVVQRTLVNAKRPRPSAD